MSIRAKENSKETFVDLFVRIQQRNIGHRFPKAQKNKCGAYTIGKMNRYNCDILFTLVAFFSIGQKYLSSICRVKTPYPFSAQGINTLVASTLGYKHLTGLGYKHPIPFQHRAQTPSPLFYPKAQTP